ncbi:hypothetical protein [Lewinella sp. IMCC34183]|uniref:hypothetical protein n=1 Tax=Lewinella sp. IMCC34183 TaxID=2248762 RepID=UPI0018E525B3|nr:hypothetical protein [Lewinella sp. IMCC34183]
MNRDELKHSGLLDQYVLGLLGPERSGEVEQMIAEDPFLQQEVDRLRKELTAYADFHDIAPPPSGRGPRTAEEFQDLDHEMITAMVEHNHSLNIWRYVLLAVCLLLIGTSGYLFRLKEEYRGDLVTERALRAQDHASYETDLYSIEQGLTASGVDSLTTVEGSLSTGGQVHVHFLSWARVALLDLTDAPPPAEGHVYVIYPASDTEFAPHQQVVRTDEIQNLRTVRLSADDNQIRIYDWDSTKSAEPNYGDKPLSVILLP